MKSSLPTVIFISVAAIVVAITPEDGPLCCGNETMPLKLNNLASWEFKCENGELANMPCSVSDMTIVNDGIREFISRYDDGTQMYMDRASIVNAPYYCVGNTTASSFHNNNWRVIGCESQLTRRDHNYVGGSVTVTIIALFFMLSGIFSALTALIYFFIRQTQDIEGKCTFHLTLNQSLMYLLGSYWCISANSLEASILDDFCVGYFYLLIFVILGYFLWSALLAFDIKRRFRYNLRTNELKQMRIYLIIGYGIPAVLVALSNLHIYGYYYYSGGGDYEITCLDHRLIMLALYAAVPILICLVTGGFFFVSLQRQLWSAQPQNASTNSTSKLRKFRFRLLLNAKIFVLTGLPWLLIVICTLLAAVTRFGKFFHYLIIPIFFFVACEGEVVFFMLVLSRKRILRGIADLFGLTVTGWNPMPESEESIAYSNENENEFGREL